MADDDSGNVGGGGAAMEQEHQNLQQDDEDDEFLDGSHHNNNRNNNNVAAGQQFSERIHHNQNHPFGHDSSRADETLLAGGPTTATTTLAAALPGGGNPATTTTTAAPAISKEMLQVEVELRLLEALEIYHPAKLQGIHRHFILYGLMEYLERRLNHHFSSDEILELLDRFYNLDLLKPDQEECELLSQEEDFSLPASILSVKEELRENS